MAKGRNNPTEKQIEMLRYIIHVVDKQHKIPQDAQFRASERYTLHALVTRGLLVHEGGQWTPTEQGRAMAVRKIDRRKAPNTCEVCKNKALGKKVAASYPTDKKDYTGRYIPRIICRLCRDKGYGFQPDGAIVKAESEASDG